MMIAECHQLSFYSYFFYFCCSVAFDFTLIPRICSLRYLVIQTVPGRSPISCSGPYDKAHILVMPQEWYHCCTSISRRKDISVDLRVCIWLGIYISPLVACRVTFCLLSSCFLNRVDMSNAVQCIVSLHGLIFN